ncbi:hypothetical protein PG985_010453 [Apiospora marii]|uniref:Brl1/Brr6 domain-containing protein n=1 Tax=Apiospora marii TaxID=335849 RepID=A0ABR1RZB1_9PEZI
MARTYESPMDWEYQTQGPMDPTSPFVRSIQNAQKTNTAFGATRPGALAANSTPNLNMFSRTQSSSSSSNQPPPSNRNDAQSSSTSTSSSAHPTFQRTSTAPPFRNPAFTTPRKPFDMDPLSEVEDSPAATDPDASELYDPDTPEDNYRSIRHVSLTPARSKSLLQVATRRSPGKGEIPNGRMTMFGTRDKIRKRKRRHDDKDISGYRLPYKYSNEWEESEDPDSDDSTYEPNERPRSRSHASAQKKGWFANFLSTVSQHPTAPHVLGYWLTLIFNAAIIGLMFYILVAVITSFRHEMSLVNLKEKSSVLDEITKCTQQYVDNRCHPRDKRLPALDALCNEWDICMNQNPNPDYHVRHGAKNMVEIANTIFETMHWKTMAALSILAIIVCLSGATLFKTSPPAFAQAPYHPQPSQAAINPQPYYYNEQKPPRTPHRGAYAALMQDETPDTDASPESTRPPLLLPYETPGRRRSPSKHRSRSPTKNRSPSKRY